MLHPEWIFLLIFFLINACEPVDPPIYDPGTPPIRSGAYEIKENIDNQDRTYEMGVHWIKDQIQSSILLCNFADRKIEVIAYLNDGYQISIPSQHFTSDFRTFEIMQGTGVLTPNGFQLTYSAREDNEHLTVELEAKVMN
jgi:hypothetical protein